MYFRASFLVYCRVGKDLLLVNRIHQLTTQQSKSIRNKYMFGVPEIKILTNINRAKNYQNYFTYNAVKYFPNIKLPIIKSTF